MWVALRNSYIEFVTYQGLTEKYPPWFIEEMYECIHMDESRYTFWVSDALRKPDYYDKQLVEDYSVFLRKPNGEVYVTDWDIFTKLYMTFKYDQFMNSGIAALRDDCIEYVECEPGILTREYPLWFYEHFTEAVNFPQEETILFSVNGEVVVNQRCIFLRNKYGEIKGMSYGDFIKYYDDSPNLGGWMRAY